MGHLFAKISALMVLNNAAGLKVDDADADKVMQSVSQDKYINNQPFCTFDRSLLRAALVATLQCSGKLSLHSRSCFLFLHRFGYYGLALFNQSFTSDFCLTGVPQRMTFANYESAFPNVPKSL